MKRTRVSWWHGLCTSGRMLGLVESSVGSIELDGGQHFGAIVAPYLLVVATCLLVEQIETARARFFKRNRRTLAVAGMLLGAGLGSWAGDIVFGHLLGWHRTPFASDGAIDVASLQFDAFWNGVSQALSWLLVTAAVVRIWSLARRADVPWSTRTIVGSTLLGAGYFHGAEGVVNHHFVQLHHVGPEGGSAFWDLVHSGAAFALCFVGLWLARPRSKLVRRPFDDPTEPVAF